MSLFAVLALKMCFFLAFERDATIDEETVSEEYESI